MTEPRRCAVLGSPVEHSLSPALHRAAYAHLGLDWTYERHRVEAEELADFVAGLDDTWRGLSCTMPLKHAVVPLGVGDDVVALLGVGNTLIFDGTPADVTTTRVANTDVRGLEDALRSVGLGTVTRGLLVGNGATARSSVLALSHLGATEVDVMARDAAKTAHLAELGERVGVAVRHIGLDATPDPVDVALSSVPAAAAGEVADRVAAAALVIFDALYDPWPTRLAEVGRAAGRVLVNGLDLLAHQAVGQILLMTGCDVPAEVLLTAGRSELSRRRRA